MKRVQLYLVRQLAVSTLVAFSGLFLVALPGVGVNAFAKLGAGGAAAAIGFVPYLFGELAQYMLPIGFLMAVVVTFGRLAADNEWLALTLSGMHPLKAIWPTIAFALLLGALHFPLAAYIAPGLKVSQRQYLQDAILESVRKLDPGRPRLEFKGFYLSAAQREGEVFHDVIVHVPAGSSGLEDNRTIRASRARVWIDGQVLRAELEDPVSRDGSEQYSGSRASLAISAEDLLGGGGGFRMKLQYLDSRELAARIARGELEGDDLRRARFELQNRRAAALAYLLFLLWGLPVGLMAQRRSMLSSFVVTIGFGIVYYVLSIRFLREAGYSGALPPAVAAWSTPLVGSLLGSLLWRNGLRPRARG